MDDHHAPAFIADPIRSEILEGLNAPQKRLPSKLFYDEKGSALFEDICELPEYYVTRTELSIMRAHVVEMARMFGDLPRVVELGSGSSVKSRLLLDQLLPGSTYVPVDISREHLMKTAAQLRLVYPQLQIEPLTADFATSLDLPAQQRGGETVVYFPGSTIGNFEPTEAVDLLRNIRSLLSAGGGLLLGVDLKKDRATLEAAYDDAAGVTAAFNLNLLSRLNRDYHADFDLAAFRHRADFNLRRSRIEMHLVSLQRQRFSIFGEAFVLEEGESLHTENSHKYSDESLQAMAENSGFAIAKNWTDPARRFAVQWWTPFMA